MEQNRSKYRTAKMAQWLQVSESGYYAWRKRSKSLRSTENEALLKEIIQIHEASHGAYGGRKITHEINRKSEKPVSHKRAGRIMRENGIRSKSHKKYKAATSSKHNLPVAENILNRDFTAGRPGQKMVSDITYIPTDEGWLYPAGVMDLCGDKIAGTAMGGTYDKRTGDIRTEGCHPPYKDYKGLYPALRQGKPVLLTGLSGTGRGAWIHQQHEPERELPGQCADGELPGEVKTGMVKRTAFPHPGGSRERGI